MATYNKARIALGLCFACVLSFNVHAAQAAYPTEMIPGGDQVFGDFVVGPTKIDLTIEPGQSRQVELMVTNRMGDRREFRLEVEDTKGSDDPRTTVVLLGNDRGPYSLRDYISFPEVSFVLSQGERARIPVTVSVPADAQPGGLYGSVLVTTHTLPKEGDETIQGGAKAGSVIVSRVGALFFVTVPGAIARDGFLESFQLSPLGKKFYDQGPINFQILFRNNGTVHLNPSATLSIRNMFGEEVGAQAIEPWYAFPQSLRMREASWDRKYLFGKYTAEVQLKRGYDEKIDTAQVTFYVIPWMPIAGAFAALVLLFFFLRLIFRSFEIKRR